MIAIVGSLGNMGSRYSAILNHLGVVWRGIDLNTPATEVDSIAKEASGIIVATPTDAHFKNLMHFHRYKKPILCEKPFTKSMNELGQIVELYERDSLSMVLQYSELINPVERGDSYYNYFRHGSDGLIWDCIQIIGLAKSHVSIEQTSPIWTCKINGQELSIGDMDHAYISNIKRWLSGSALGLKEIYDIHQKTYEFQLNH